MDRPPTIHIVDDDASFQVAVARLLRATHYEVRTYANAGDFLLRSLDDAPGCILLDLSMPGPSGLALQEALASRPDTLPIIFMSGHADVPATVQAMKAGAVDFLIKPVKREALLDAVRRALARDAESRAARDRLNALRARYNSLTPREIDVLEQVVCGKMNKEIAAELGASERTIKSHRAQVMQKLNVASVAELVRIADALRGSASPPPPHA